MPFFFCVIFLLVFDTLIVFLPSDSGVWKTFDLMAFEKDGKSYYNYRYYVAGGILINSALTFIAEKLIVNFLTTWYDGVGKERKRTRFNLQMEYERN